MKGYGSDNCANAPTLNAPAAPDVAVKFAGVCVTADDVARWRRTAELRQKEAATLVVNANAAERMLAEATPITLTVPSPDELPVSYGTRLYGTLSKGRPWDREVTIERRAAGEYKGAGFFITPAPSGYRWTVVQDSDNCTVLVLQRA